MSAVIALVYLSPNPHMSLFGDETANFKNIRVMILISEQVEIKGCKTGKREAS